MGKASGFMEYTRVENPYRGVRTIYRRMLC